jgi:hypothetical protein
LDPAVVDYRRNLPPDSIYVCSLKVAYATALQGAYVRDSYATDGMALQMYTQAYDNPRCRQYLHLKPSNKDAAVADIISKRAQIAYARGEFADSAKLLDSLLDAPYADVPSTQRNKDWILVNAGTAYLKEAAKIESGPDDSAIINYKAAADRFSGADLDKLGSSRSVAVQVIELNKDRAVAKAAAK